jgi:hypothetical protein
VQPVLDSGLSAGMLFWAFTELGTKIVSHVMQTAIDTTDLAQRVVNAISRNRLRHVRRK